jgi:hypothetical protein
MVSIVVAFSIASVLTAIFAFRFRNSRRPLLLAGYFLVFFVVEWVASYFFIPPGAFGMEIALVCFPLTVVFIFASVLSHRWEADEDTRR